MSRLEKVSRRQFLGVVPAVGAGLVIGLRIGDDPVAHAATEGATPAAAGAETGRLAPNAFLQIDKAGAVTLWTSKSEMGQGVRTALPMILAEEIGADFATVKVEQAWLDPRFGDLDTGGSTSVRTSWEPLRKAGAAARAMLIAAAAEKLKVAPATLATEKGQILHAATGRRLPFSAVVAQAAKLEVPQNPPLKDPKAFTLVGRALPRTDTPLKVDGRALYGIDVKLPGMLYAAVVLEPTFGARPGGVDDAKARAVPGVRAVVPFRRGYAVIAESTWAAFRGRDALEARWIETRQNLEDSASIRSQCDALSKDPGKVLRDDGNFDSAFEAAATRVEALYEAPFQAHAPMEPVNATAHVTADRCEIWAPTQTPSWALEELKTLLKLPAESIRINITFLGGGFGRRINPDFILDAAEISRAVGAPVKMVWSREQDIQHDYYRPCSLHRMAAGLDGAGMPVAWRHRFVTPSISAWYDPNTKEPESDEHGGAADVAYAVPNLRVEYRAATSLVPRGWWRSVEASFNAFAVESFVDELAAAAGKDPYQMRLDLLREPRTLTYPNAPFVQETARLAGVLRLAAGKSLWSSPPPKGIGRGIAAQYGFRSYCAMVAEVEVRPSGAPRVNRIVCAVDCGRVVNPGVLASQVESAVVFGLTAALKSAITIERGRVAQSNFHDYEMLRIDEMPRVETHIVPSDAPPTGIGEPAVPVVAPAVFNALYAATGKRVRRLPLQPGDLKPA